MYRIQTVYFYEDVEGTDLDLDLDLDLFYYKLGDSSYVLTLKDNGVKIGPMFDSVENLLSYIKRNKDKINTLLHHESYIDTVNRLSNLMSKDEFSSKLDLFEDNIGIGVFTFYNEELLMATKNTFFDLCKFDEYLEREFYNEYSLNMSTREFIDYKFGKELSDFILYLTECSNKAI